MQDRAHVVVVGAGPAGSLAARALAGEGIDTVLLDRHAFPRDKVCGDALLPDAVAALGEAGIEGPVRRESLEIPRAVFRSPAGHQVEIAGRFLTIRRHRLDAILLEGALGAGARFFPRFTAAGPLEERGRIAGVRGNLPGGASCEIRADAVVLACGANAGLLGAFGVLTRAAASAVAIRAYLQEDPFARRGGALDALLISYERPLLPGYGWSFPLPGGEWNVGCGVFHRAGRGRRSRGRGVDLREKLLSFLGSRDGAAALSRAAAPGSTPAPPPAPWLSGVRGAVLRTGLRGSVPVRGSVLVAGEALGLTLPLTGDGIGKAMQSGLLAAGVLAGVVRGKASSADLGRYAREIESRALPVHRAYEAAARWMRAPVVPDLIVRRASKSTSLRRLIEEIVAETADPRALLSPTGLLRALVS